MGISNPVHIAFIALVALLVLGPKRLPDVARALGNGMREFKQAMGMASIDPHQILQPQPQPQAAPTVAPQPQAAATVAATAVAEPPIAAPPAYVQEEEPVEIQYPPIDESALVDVPLGVFSSEPAAGGPVVSEPATSEHEHTSQDHVEHHAADAFVPAQAAPVGVAPAASDVSPPADASVPPVDVSPAGDAAPSPGVE